MSGRKFFGNKYISVFLALLCVTLWGTAFPVIKSCYTLFSIPAQDYSSKVLFAGYRFFLAGVMVLFVGIISRKKFIYPTKRDILPIGVLGFLQIFLQYLFSYIGLSNTTGTKTSVITALGTFFGVLLTPLFFKGDSLTVKKIVGCGVGFAGVVVINLQGITEGGFAFLGEGFVVLSAIMATAGSLFSKKVSQGRNPMAVSAYHLLFGGAGLIIVGLVFGGSLQFTDLKMVLMLLYLGLVSAVSFTLWTALLKYNRASKILIFNLLIPIFGTVWSGILLGEEVLSIYNVVSVLLISVGIILVNIQKGRKENED